MDYIYGKLNIEEILKEYAAKSTDTVDLSIDNTQNIISAKVKKTPGKLTITKNITPTERETILEFDGSQNKEINLAEIDMYSGLETDTSIVTIDTENNTIKSDVKKTPGTLSFQKADLLLEETFDGSKDITVKIPETIFHGISRDNTINFETEDFSNIIYAEVNKVPNKLTIIEDLEQLNYDGSNEISIDLTKYAFKDDIPTTLPNPNKLTIIQDGEQTEYDGSSPVSLTIEGFDLQDLPQFVSKIHVDFSLDDDGSGVPVLHGLLTLGMRSSTNIYINWGDGTGNYYSEISTSVTHQYENETFDGWITIYGDWQGLNTKYSTFTPSNKRIITDIEYGDNIITLVSSMSATLTNLKSLKLPYSLNAYGGFVIDYDSPLSGTQLNSFNIPENVTTFSLYALAIEDNIVDECILPVSVDSLRLFMRNSTITVKKVTILNNKQTLSLPSILFGDINAPNTTWFVPYNFLSEYKQGTNWTIFADKIYPIGGNYTESITIPSTSWDAETKTVTVTAIGATSEDRNVVMPSIPSEYDDYGIRCTAQGIMTLTFTCDEIPTEDITIGVAYILTNQ